VRAQVSPGPLAQAHANLDGALQCLKCHERGNPPGAMDRRCLACHDEVAWMRDRERGFHARVADRPCASCHPDHGGRAFRLVAWDEGSPERFDHRRAGWALEGKHAGLECRACHQPRLQTSGAAALLRQKDHAKSWLGLETACASCHEDPHRGQIGTRCESCHGVSAWKPASGFDHQKTDYPLTGAHVKTECAACHLAPRVVTAQDAKGQPIAQWKPLAHAECGACHKDPHAGRFGAACAKCHTTADFKVIETSRFDHDRTRYPLSGGHARVKCERCHDPKLGWGAKPRFDRCGACHRDAHNGTATLAGAPADCASCHDVNAFRPSTYTAAQHQRSAYPLAGRHGSAACSGCHSQLPEGAVAAVALGPSRVVLRPRRARCTDCHVDPHGGRYDKPRAGVRGDEPCLACHRLEGFHPSSMDVAAHARTAFVLEGAHRAVPCQACHAELRGRGAASTLLSAAVRVKPLGFQVAKQACADCHETPHGDQFAARRDRGACQSCHGVESFAPATAFDHNRDAAFKLEGAHARTPCARCHPSQRAANGRMRIVYRPLSLRCESCHGESTTPPTGKSGRGASRLGPEPAGSNVRLALTTREVPHARIH
jgi:hypothetical protein